MMKRLFATLSLVALSAPAPAQEERQAPPPGEPPITALTRASAGPISATQRGVRFDHANIAIEVFPDRKQIQGVATLEFATLARLDSVTLDLDRNLPVSSVSVNGTVLRKGAWSNPEGKLRIRLPRPVAAGQRLSVRIAYGGTPHVAVRAPWDGGIVWSKTPQGAPWIATAHQLQGCDLLWPCIDHPQAEAALTDIHITVPAGLSAPANGVLQGVRTLPDGRRTFDWRAKNLNTYAVNLNIAPYEVIRGSYKSRFGNTIPLEFWHLPGRPERSRMLFAEFAPTLEFFEAMIGPYPFGDEKLGVAETPHLGMEHQTMNAYGANYRRDAYGFDSLFQHEFSHEYFANQLTNVDADDFWLQEGFGSYMQPLYAQWRGGEMAYLSRLFDLRAGLRNCFPIVSGRTRTVEQVYLPATGPSGDIYAKAAWMLHTLRGLIGDEDFFAATRRIVYGRTDPKPGNFKPRFGSSEEFQRIVEDETGKDYGWFFDVYLRQAQLPELVSEGRDGRLHLSWKAPGGGGFPMPVEVKIGDRIERVAMTGGKGSVAVPAGAHVVLDPGSKILKRSADIDALQLWQHEEAVRNLKSGDQGPSRPCIAT
jgi:aminopeptidase N